MKILKHWIIRLAVMLVILVITLTIAGGIFSRWQQSKHNQISQPIEFERENVIKEEVVDRKTAPEQLEQKDDAPNPPAPTIKQSSPVIAQSYKINGIPFTPQAPFANWDAERKEACEEAAVLMVIEWLNGEEGIPNEGSSGWLNQKQTDDELLKMIDWQKQNYGGHYDLAVEQTADFIKNYYQGKYVAQLQYDIDIDDIKRELSQNNPVIVPAAGREMGNRYFQTPGPIYHMTVIIGYDGKNFIANDPGTKQGLNYKYQENKLFNSIHDWTGSGENIGGGRKAMMIIK